MRRRLFMHIAYACLCLLSRLIEERLGDNMSVPVGKRGKNKNELWLKSVDLVKYTVEITSNTKNFPGRYRSIVDRINDAAVGVAYNLWKARRAKMQGGDNAKENCVDYQNNAINDLDALLFLIELVGDLLKRDSRKTTYWANKIIAVKDLTVQWQKADRPQD